MVFLSPGLWRKITYVKPSRGPDRYWRNRKILRMAAHFYGRRRNCITVAMNAVRRALRSSTLSRNTKSSDTNELNIARLNAACEEHGFSYPLFKEGLVRSNILLNNKILCDMAIWEPRTFKSIIDFAWNRAKSEGLNGIDELADAPKGVILKPMIVKT